ncbi:MAG: dihydroorotase family protein [Candidatus Helarchaeota archaeon]|nr:dihydroorotase family protein [Candidatus Helarchaeota archaeon]
MSERESKSVDLIIKNAKIFFNQQVMEGGIAVDQGKIVKVSKNTKLPPGEEIIDAKRRLIIPGIIDIHAHLRDLEFNRKENFYTGTCAAANGGITTIVDMPNTKPPTISPKLLEEKIDLARKKVIINVGFYAGIPDKVEEIDSFRNHGIFGFKLFLASSLSQFDMTNSELLIKLLGKIKDNNCPLLIHAERKKDIEEILKQKKGSNLSSQELYLVSHSENVEKKAIEYIFELNARIGAPIHICHVSTASGVEIIQQSKNQGRKITCEVTPHHLFLTTVDLKKYGAFAKMLPPLRTSRDLDALWRGLNNGIIDIIATDHAPHMLSEKECEFSRATSGIPGFETLLPLLITAMQKNQITLPRLVQSMSENPAKFLNLSNKGKIQVGYDADFTIIDLKKQQKIEASKFYSMAKFSPFNGREMRGVPTMTIVNGEIIMREGEIMVPQGSGNIIRRP